VKARGIHAASACEVGGSLERVDALGWRMLKRRERRGPGFGGWLTWGFRRPAGVPALPAGARRVGAHGLQGAWWLRGGRGGRDLGGFRGLQFWLCWGF